MTIQAKQDLMIMLARLTEAYIESAPTTQASTGQPFVVDLNLSQVDYGRGFADDEFNGAAFIPLDNPSQYIVTNYVSATSTLTVSPDLSLTLAVGTPYLILSNRYPLHQARSALSAALYDLPPILYENTSLVTAANTLEYTLNDASLHPAGKLLEVWVATLANSPYYYERALGVRAYTDDTASASPGIRLVFPCQPPSGRKIKLIFSRPAATLAGIFDTPSTTSLLPIERAQAQAVALDAAVRLVRWRTQQAGADLERLMPLLNDLSVRRAKAQGLVPAKRVQAQPVLPFTEVR